MVYCNHCGNKQPEPVSVYCPYCGKQNLIISVYEEAVNLRKQIAEFGFKNPTLAGLLGLIVPGLGHVYLGNVGFAVLLFIFGVIIAYFGGLAALLVSIGSAWMAYDEVTKTNAIIERLVQEK